MKHESNRGPLVSPQVLIPTQGKRGLPASSWPPVVTSPCWSSEEWHCEVMQKASCCESCGCQGSPLSVALVVEGAPPTELNEKVVTQEVVEYREEP